jgi:membrane associated rhomboid family serine protease
LLDRRVLAFLVLWFIGNLLFGTGIVTIPGAEQSVAWEAHIGGFLAGLFGFALFDPPPPPLPPIESEGVDAGEPAPTDESRTAVS